MRRPTSYIKRHLYKVPLLLAVVLILAAALTPLLLVPKNAEAAGQLGHRSVTITSGVPSKTGVTYTFAFQNVSTTPINAIKFIACDTAVGTYRDEGTSVCSANTATNVPNLSIATYGSKANFADAGVDFAKDAGTNNFCDATAGTNILCLDRTGAATAQGAGSSLSIVINGVTNPGTANLPFFIGIYTYNAKTDSTALDSGTTASAVVQTLETDALLPEVLNFCIGAEAVNDTTTTDPGADCTAVSGTSVNIGTLDTSTINISPINTNGGNNFNGIAMLRTNALNGTTVSYDAIQDTGTNHLGTLRVAGSNCLATSGPGTGSPPAASGPFTDSCIDAAGATQNPLGAGSEEFGMTVAGVNSKSTTSYTCDYLAAPSSCHLEPSTNYMGAGSVGSEAFGTSNGFAWVEDGTITQIASSTQAVDDETLVLKFAATPAITTPFGQYSVRSDYIAVPTY